MLFLFVCFALGVLAMLLHWLLSSPGAPRKLREVLVPAFAWPERARRLGGRVYLGCYRLA